MYIMSTETKEEEKDILKLFIKHSRKIGIRDSFENDDGREFESAFAWDWPKGKNLTGCIYIHLKKIQESALDHELIHALNCVNEQYAVSTKGANDEAVACFFTYMKESIVQLIKENGIRIIRNRITPVKKVINKETKQEQ